MAFFFVETVSSLSYVTYRVAPRYFNQVKIGSGRSLHV